MLSKQYQPQEVEARIYQKWLDQKCFASENISTKPPYAIILPPPNVTGFLHIGHALNHTIQDVLIRWKRMSGYNTVWVPGTDHAGIATQSVVEKSLAEEGLSCLELGRQSFEAKVWNWKYKYGDQIISQMKCLGSSCDWDRLTFTLDPEVSKAVKRVFIALYEKSLIYKGEKLVHWSPKLQTAISDIEVEYKEVKGKLYHIYYPLENQEEGLTIATTRPETLLGDCAVAVHPEDERYKKRVGQNLVLPIVNRLIPIIADEYVDKDFGSGAVKITPAHDFNDYEVGLRHKLDPINILEPHGVLTQGLGEFSGLNIQEARKQIVKRLEEQGYIKKIEVHNHSVGHCSRTGRVAEPYLSKQWFLKMQDLAEPAIYAVKNGTTKFVPESWTKTYMHWLTHIQDWCISRQLWWGHRIPVWTCQDCDHMNVSGEDHLEFCQKCRSESLIQDPDVLDTWFSSALWPFSTLGWPEETEALKTFYPTDVLVTGHDIIFFWVARMMMQGLEFQKDVPFRTVYLHGLVRDSLGQKMSKSLGNSVDPVEAIDKYGADALRISLLSQLHTGKDIKFSQARLESYRNFMNKIWNAARFSLGAADVEFSQSIGFSDLSSENTISIFDQWIIFKTGCLMEDVNLALQDLRFSDAVSAIYLFAWQDFCDWYLEFSKISLYETKDSYQDHRKTTSVVLFQVLGRLLKLMHPFVPFISEEIFSKLPIKDEDILCTSKFPKKGDHRAWIEQGSENSWLQVEWLKEIISGIRNIRGENSIALAEKIEVYIFTQSDKAKNIIEDHKGLIQKFCQLSELSIQDRSSRAQCAVSLIKFKELSAEVIVPLEGLVDINQEIQRIEKNMDKIKKDINMLSKKLSNENFIKNAPPELVSKDKQLLEDAENKFKTLQASLNRLKLSQ